MINNKGQMSLLLTVFASIFIIFAQILTYKEKKDQENENKVTEKENLRLITENIELSRKIAEFTDKQIEVNNKLIGKGFGWINPVYDARKNIVALYMENLRDSPIRNILYQSFDYDVIRKVRNKLPQDLGEGNAVGFNFALLNDHSKNARLKDLPGHSSIPIGNFLPKVQDVIDNKFAYLRLFIIGSESDTVTYQYSIIDFSQDGKQLLHNYILFEVTRHNPKFTLIKEQLINRKISDFESNFHYKRVIHYNENL